jgi:hypothetical protein
VRGRKPVASDCEPQRAAWSLSERRQAWIVYDIDRLKANRRSYEAITDTGFCILVEFVAKIE